MAQSHLCTLTLASAPLLWQLHSYPGFCTPTLASAGSLEGAFTPQRGRKAIPWAQEKQAA